MDFAMLAPEINSTRMYAGPGAGPMLAAAEAWDGLATELYSAASSYRTVTAGLTAGPWLGPSSASMAASAATYATWLTGTAAQAEQTASQAKAAAAAHAIAFAATVPPTAVLANRSLLMHLVATNLFGQNTPAISATETQYAEMWAQDAGAMYGYAASSASATTLTPFTPPPRTTNPGGSTAAVAQATGTSAVANAQKVLSQLTTALPTTLQGLTSPAAQPAALAASLPPLSELLQGLELTSVTGYAALGVGSADLSATSGAWKAATDADTDTAMTLDDINNDTNAINETLNDVRALAGRLNPANLAGAVGSTLSASMGGASSIGALSVPPAWSAAAPAMKLAAVALPATSLGAAAEAAAGVPGSLFSQMALASMAGRALGGAGGPGRWGRVAAGTRAHEAPQLGLPCGSVSQIAADLRVLAELRDSGILTEEEFLQQKSRVLA